MVLWFKVINIEKKKSELRAENSVGSFGENAYIHGLNITFIVMTCATSILLFIAVFCVKEKNKSIINQ